MNSKYKKISGRKKAFKFLNALKFIEISNNLVDLKSLITHPSSTTHSKLPENEKKSLRILENLIRLLWGLESPSDLIADIEQEIEKS